MIACARAIHPSIYSSWHLHQCGHDAIAVDLVQRVVVLRDLGCHVSGTPVVTTPRCEAFFRTRRKVRSGGIKGHVGNEWIRSAVEHHQGPRRVLRAQLGQWEDLPIVHQLVISRKARDRRDQVASLGQDALRHRAPVGVAGEVDTGGVDGVRDRHLRHHLLTWLGLSPGLES